MRYDPDTREVRIALPDTLDGTLFGEGDYTLHMERFNNPAGPIGSSGAPHAVLQSGTGQPGDADLALFPPLKRIITLNPLPPNE